jgi:cytochrome P450
VPSLVIAHLLGVPDGVLELFHIVHSQVDRVVTEDLTLGGQQIQAGDWLVMNLPAGNWDPAFVDNPDVLDGDRNARGHLGFGFCVHQCIGANLARVEMQIAFATLARRVPGLQLAAGVDN